MWTQVTTPPAPTAAGIAAAVPEAELALEPELPGEVVPPGELRLADVLIPLLQAAARITIA
ncbi:MAG: hypothetical protein PVS3B2_12620 [Candidatus Dormibacteraceae bacterium]